MSAKLASWRLAASVIPLNVQLHQVLVLRRGATAKFMPNSYVFPGGTVDHRLDAQFPMDRTNFDDMQEEEQPIRLGLDSDFPLRVCALREMFEESGLLPVTDEKGGHRTVLSAAEDQRLAEWRKKILADPKLFPELFSSAQKMDVSGLIPWANWLTPMREYSTRYDTAFFVLPTDESPKSAHCTHEMMDALWAEPSQIIERSAKSEVSLPPPQFYELLRIRLLNITKPEQFRQQTNPMRICPHIFRVEGQPDLIVNVMPGDHLYDVERPECTESRVLLAKQLLPPYPDDPALPIHRMIYRSNEPHLQYHQHELHMKNFENMAQKFHLFFSDTKKHSNTT